MSKPGQSAVLKPLETEALSKAGGRESNEDDFGCVLSEDGRSGCWVVADGLGGHRGGETAAKIAVETILSTYRTNPAFAPETIRAGLLATQKEIRRQQEEDPRLYGMRTTAVVLLVQGDRALWAHVGDTRLYLFREGKPIHQTQDHSVTRALYDAGQLTTEQIRTDENRNRLTRVLGKDEDVEPTFAEPVRLHPGDAFLLCTDGFWEHVDEPTMSAELAAASGQPPKAWLDGMEPRLLQKVTGDYDNYTAVAVYCHPPRPARVVGPSPEPVTEIVRSKPPQPVAPVPAAPPVEPPAPRPTPEPATTKELEPKRPREGRRRRRPMMLLGVLGSIVVPAVIAWIVIQPRIPRPGESPTEPNRPPRAVADVVEVDEQNPGPYPIRVLENDEDPDGDELKLASVNRPLRGELTWDEEGVLYYVPPEGSTEAETVTYEVTDGRGATVEGTVEIRVKRPEVPPTPELAPTPEPQQPAPEPQPPTPMPPPTPEPQQPAPEPQPPTPMPPPTPEPQPPAPSTPTPPPSAPEPPPPTIPGPPPPKPEPPPPSTDPNEGGENRPPVFNADAAKWETSAETEVVIDLRTVVSDPDDDPVTVKSVSTSDKGMITRRPDGTLVYKPKPGATGTDRFTLDVSDGENTVTGTATVAISPNSLTVVRSSSNGLEYARIPADETQGVKQSFWLGTTEVPYGVFKKYLQDKGKEVPKQHDDSTDEHPIINVLWAEAKDFCESTGGRLPTEAEWRYAARAGRQNATYPWGEDDPTCFEGKATDANFSKCRKKMPVQVGLFRVNSFQLHNMAGNVSEWCQDEADGKHIYLGGSFKSDKNGVVTAERQLTKDKTFADVGFRCARDQAP